MYLYVIEKVICGKDLDGNSRFHRRRGKDGDGNMRLDVYHQGDSIRDAKKELELTESSWIHETPNLVIPRRLEVNIFRSRNYLLQRLS